MGPVNQSILYQIDETIIDDIRQELALQGHYLTGALEASIKEKLIHEGGAVILSAEALGYIETLEKYTPPDQIKIDNAEFEKLKRWVILRGLANFDHEATAVAAAIVSHWKVTGRPTPGSKEFSQTGKRTEAIQDTFTKNEVRYTQMLDHGLTSMLDVEASDLEFGKNATI